MPADKKIKMSLVLSSCVAWLCGATISLPGHNEHERMRDLYQTGYKIVGYVNHARVACNVTGSSIVRASTRRIFIEGTRSSNQLQGIFEKYSIARRTASYRVVVELLETVKP